MRAFILLLALLSVPAAAQTLVEISTVVAISSTLDSRIKLPSGSFKAGKGSEEILARIPDRAKFAAFEVYAAKGIAAKLHAGFVHQVLTSFAVAGYFVESQQEKKIGDEIQTRYNLVDDEGRPGILFVVRKSDELVYVIGKVK